MQRIAISIALACSLAACERELDLDGFKREAEKAYVEVHPGWGMARREGTRTMYVRGDQLDTLDFGKMFDEYKKSGKTSSQYFEAWTKAQEEEERARKRTLDQAK